VNSLLAVAALILFVSLMLVLPLIPAFVELRSKSDASPLKVVQQHAGEIRHFANSFRTYIQVLEPTLQQCVVSGATASGMLPDGVEYLALGQCNDSHTLPIQQRGAICRVTIAAGSDLVVPAETTFLRDVYAGGRFSGGDNNSYRAILGEKDVHLGHSSLITRWVHAVGEFSAEHDCSLSGRISSDSCIRLQGTCNFLRLNAPKIETGHVMPGKDSTRPPAEDKSNAGSGVVQRFLYDGDFEVHADELVTGNIVARGKLHIGSGARIRGSVKSVSDMVLGAGVSVQGSLISGRQMLIGPDCAVNGPIIAERALHISAGTRCGSFQHPTTVSAPRIEAEEGVVVFGTLWAREHGEVVASR
jgi:cytoskeletal protein CcmA (bactofilin family)